MLFDSIFWGTFFQTREKGLSAQKFTSNAMAINFGRITPLTLSHFDFIFLHILEHIFPSFSLKLQQCCLRNFLGFFFQIEEKRFKSSKVYFKCHGHKLWTDYSSNSLSLCVTKKLTIRPHDLQGPFNNFEKFWFPYLHTLVHIACLLVDVWRTFKWKACH